MDVHRREAWCVSTYVFSESALLSEVVELDSLDGLLNVWRSEDPEVRTVEIILVVVVSL